MRTVFALNDGLPSRDARVKVALGQIERAQARYVGIDSLPAVVGRDTPKQGDYCLGAQRAKRAAKLFGLESDGARDLQVLHAKAWAGFDLEAQIDLLALRRREFVGDTRLLVTPQLELGLDLHCKLLRLDVVNCRPFGQRGLESERGRLEADFVQLKAGLGREGETDGGSAGSLGEFHSHVIKTAGGVEIADVALDSAGVVRPAHLCFQVHLETSSRDDD
jgi:hypothetical protein